MTDMEICVDPLRTLELTQISEEIFYGRVLHSDLDTLVKDIRIAHEKDSTTAEAEITAQNMALLLRD